MVVTTGIAKPCWSTVPPGTVRLLACSAPITCFTEILSAASFVGSSVITSWRVSPPLTSTLKTPFILLSSGTIWSRASWASCAGVSLLEVRLSWTMGCEAKLKVCTCGVAAPCGSASDCRLL